MNMRSLVPLRNNGIATRPDFAFGSLQREIDRLFDAFVQAAPAGGGGPVLALLPSMDVTESDKEIEVTAELPGLERKDVEISVDNGALTVRGEKKVEREEKEKKNYHLSERSYGMFLRVIPLPEGVDPASIEATMSKGVLRITIPKPAHAEPRKIEVKDA